MSDEKKMKQPDDYTIAELMDAFGGYEPDVNADDVDAMIDVADDLPADVETTAGPVIEAEDIPAEEEEQVSEKKTVKHRKKDSEKEKKSRGTEKNSDNKNNKKSKKKKDNPDETEDAAKPASSLKLVITLTAICAAVALLLATVNHFTEAKIAANNEAAMLSSIRDIFDESVEAEYVAVVDDPEYSSQMLTHAFLITRYA